MGRTGVRDWSIIAAVVGIVLAIAVPRLWRPRQVEPDLPAVLLGVQKLNQLATVKYTLQQVVGIREDKQPVGSESMLLILQATVQGGVDLAGMQPGDVSVRPDKTVVLRLPEAKILSVIVDEKATRVWDRQKTWWTPWVPYSLDMEQRARIAGIESVKRAAVEMGILQDARRNAESAIRSFLEMIGVKSVVVAAS